MGDHFRVTGMGCGSLSAKLSDSHPRASSRGGVTSRSPGTTGGQPVGGGGPPHLRDSSTTDFDQILMSKTQM